ncbi:Hypothetical protein NGAL_HAMBI1145_23000 [Neorhizobium galegae bv. officinalis]|jgi:hypothetical protein|uniref:Uncharacterized protein n=1 Tax=Neorhizobium galegae bv. officinalis TaxID=323656 RepID=A0A0T7FH78_NEOGA|nr:hypothetical protein [Neorhizobium galegae]CDZ34323.1 Hypothetical protein NGAL_HAMBI1145_23000 [Neorhizobium galegae bv. officinalis]
MAEFARSKGSQDRRDARDRLILALYAQLKAERQTREALEYVIRNGALAPEVLEAIAGDPIPAATAEDVAAVEKVIALDAHRRQAAFHKSHGENET